MDWMPTAIRDGVIVILVISGPLVLAAAFIGLAIGILQAATQVQEQTIGSALKIIGVFAMIIFAGFWMYQYLRNYTFRTLTSAFTFIPQQTQKAVPKDAFKDDDFNIRFEGEEPNKPIKLIKPERLEVESLPGGEEPSLGAPYLGAPEIPKPPQVTKISPPSLPELPEAPLKTRLPLSDFQEPIPISTPKVPSIEDLTEQKVVNPEVRDDEKAAQELQDTTMTETNGAVNDGQKEGDSPSWLE